MKLKHFGRVGTCLATVALLALSVPWLRGAQAAWARGQASNLFVRPDGSGDACTQGSPCALASALKTAQNGDTLYLAEGTYTGSGAAVMRIQKNLIILGAWDGSTTAPPVRDPATLYSILDGQGQRRVIQVDRGVALSLDGLEVTRGAVRDQGAGLFAEAAHLSLSNMQVYANMVNAPAGHIGYGGGASVQGGELYVSNSTFWGNTATGSDWGYHSGGGIYISGTVTATLEYTTFRANDAREAAGLQFTAPQGQHILVRDVAFTDNGQGYGPTGLQCSVAGGMRVTWGQAVVQDSRFANNCGSYRGGGLVVEGGSLSLDRSEFISNLGLWGSAVELMAVRPFTLTNNILFDNRSPDPGVGGCVQLQQSSNGSMRHNTLARNFGGSGLELQDASNLTALNTILVDHSVGISVGARSLARLEATLWGAGEWANYQESRVDGTLQRIEPNVYGDPVFVNPYYGDVHIGLGSAAIDRGVDAGVHLDIDRQSRPSGAGYDIGADELQVAGPTPSPSATPTPVAVGIQIYYNDVDERPGAIHHYDPGTGRDEVLFRRSSGSIGYFSLAQYPERIYYVDAESYVIYQSTYESGAWLEQGVYAPTRHARDIAIRTEPDDSVAIYFADDNDWHGDGTIFKYAHGEVTPFYVVHIAEMGNVWYGDFSFGAGGDIYLSQGNASDPGIYRVHDGTLQPFCNPPDARLVVGMSYLPGALYYGDFIQSIYRLDLTTLAETRVFNAPSLQRIGDVEVLSAEPPPRLRAYLPVIVRR